MRGDEYLRRAAVEREIARNTLPGIAALAALTEGEERAALAARYRRVETALAQT